MPSMEENNDRRTQNQDQIQNTNPKKRIRAAIACTNCRVQRSKCDGLPRGPPCSKCQRIGIPCDIPDEPKRQRFPYRAQVELLKDRVKLLEDLILQSHQQVPQDLSNGTASVPQVALGIPQAQQQRKDECSSSNQSSPGVLGILDPEIAPLDQCPIDIWPIYSPHTPLSGDVPTAVPVDCETPTKLAVPTVHPAPIQKSQCRLSNSTHGTSLISKAAARLPSSSSTTTTTNRRPFLKPTSALASARLKLTQITPETISHLLTLYFRRHQLLFKTVPETAFYRDLAAGQGPSYTPSLFCAMLAAGLRYSDNAEPFLLSNRQGDVFSKRSKELLETELRQADKRTVLTLLIVGELETARGNDMTAYLYAGLAQRLLFDLHLDLNSAENLSDTEVEIRYWLLWFASVQDQYWALTLNKPLTIKNNTLYLSRLTARLANNSIFTEPTGSSSQTRTFDRQVRESLLDLLEFAREIADTVVSWTELRAIGEAYPAMVRLNNRLDQWYAGLPPEVQQSPLSSGESSHFFLVLHIHYHATKICLRRPFTTAPAPLPTTGSTFILHPNRAPSSVFGAPEASKSRAICVTSGIEIAKIFEAFRDISDVRSVQSTGTQWATWATEALIGHMAFMQAVDRGEAELGGAEEEADVSIDEVVMHLQTAMGTLKEMAKYFKSAEQELGRAERFLEQFLIWKREREQQRGEAAGNGLDAANVGGDIGDLDMGDLGGLDACNGEYDYDFEGFEIDSGGGQQHQQQQTTRPELTRQQSNTGSLLGNRSAGDGDTQDFERSGGQNGHTSFETDLVGYQGVGGGMPGDQGLGTLWAGLFGYSY